MDKFMKEHAPKVSNNMRKSYNASLKNLLHLFGGRKLFAITPKMISEYKSLRYDDGVKPATINRELAMLSKAFNIAVKKAGIENFHFPVNCCGFHTIVISE